MTSEARGMADEKCMFLGIALGTAETTATSENGWWQDQTSRNLPAFGGVIPAYYR
jgi:hypothetical protein